MTPDLIRRRSIHIIGAGGTGMSAIAEVLAAMGHRVTGSDRAASGSLDRLAALGIGIHVGSDPSVVGQAELVARSTAVANNDAEVIAARTLGVPVLSRSEILSGICDQRRTAAVSGTHGKTTTSALLGSALGGGGWRPSWIVGAQLRGLGSGARWDDGEWLVVEADESDGTMLDLPAELALVTNVEPDHLEHYGGFDALVSAFERFLSAATGPRIISADDAVAVDLGRRTSATTYGTSSAADYRLCDVRVSADSTSFNLASGGRVLCEVTVPLPGRHNALNAAAAVVAAVEMGVAVEMAAAGVAVAPPIARRFERRGKYRGVSFVDDYAHLPGEVAAALDTARHGPWNRVVCVFQPHRFSRTAALSADFGPALATADLLWVTDVYAAGEEPRPGISGELVAHAVSRCQPGLPVRYQPDRARLVGELAGALRDGDLCLVLGAGDITALPDEVQAAFRS